MDKRFSTEEQLVRQHIWIEAWLRITQSTNTVNTSLCTKLADECLKDFDDRFHCKEE